MNKSIGNNFSPSSERKTFCYFEFFPFIHSTYHNETLVTRNKQTLVSHVKKLLEPLLFQSKKVILGLCMSKTVK